MRPLANRESARDIPQLVTVNHRTRNRRFQHPDGRDAVAGLATLIIALALRVVTPAQAQVQVARLDLTQMSLEELLDVEVTLVSRLPQRLSRTPAAATVLSGDEVRRSGARSLPEALRLIPGIQVASVDANKWVVTSRGFAGLFANKLLVLIDGRSVYTPMFSGVFWESHDIPLQDIERIEVVRGPGGSLWGANAVNGIVNVVTRDAAATSGAAIAVGGGTEARGFGTVRYGGAIGQTGHYRVYAKGQASDRSAPAGALAVGDDWRMGTAGGRVDLAVGPADDVTLQVQATDGDVGQGLTYVTRPEPPYTQTHYFDARVRTGYAMATWTHRMTGRRQVLTQAYYDRFDRREKPIRGLIQTLDIDVQHSTRWEANHQVVWGAGYRRTIDRYEGSFTMRLMPDERTVHLWSAFAHGELVPDTDRLLLSAGTKVEHNSYTGFEWQPNARLWWSPADDHGLWLSLARAVRTPSRSDHGIRAVVSVVADSILTVLSGAESFTSERVLAAELGYRGRLSQTLAIDAAGYHNQYRDLQTNELSFADLDLSRRPAELPARVGNLADATSIGLELGINWQGGDSWRMRGAYTFLDLDVDVAEGSFDTSTEGYETESPTHQLGARLMADLPRDVELDLLGRFAGAIDSHGIDPYVTADLRLSVPLGPNRRLVLVGQNLLQAEHREMASNTSGTVHSAVQRGAYAALELGL